MTGIRRNLFAAAAVLTALALALACGSGSSGDDDDDGPENATLSGTVYYEGEAQGDAVVIGLMPEWPMTSAPLQFTSVDVPVDGFPFEYEIELLHTGPYFLAAFLDVDSTDGVAINLEIDPMDVPDEGEEMQELIDGPNERDFYLVDPDEVDFWWRD